MTTNAHSTTLLLVLMCCLVATPALAALPRPVWFSYMDNTSIVDEISGYDGTNNGCTQVDRDGNNAIHCDDNSYIRTPKNSYTNLSQNFTVCWYGLANVSDGWQVAWNHYNETSLWGGYQSTTTRAVGGNPDYYDYSNVLVDGHWYHVCVRFSGAESTIDSSVISIFVNGSPNDNNAAGSASILYNDEDYILGGVNTTDNTRSAFIDNVAYFDRVLSPAEISSLWNNSGVPDLTTGFGIGECGGNLSYPFVNFSIYDEDNDSTTHVSVLEIGGDVSNGSTTVDISQTLGGDDSYLLCSNDKIGGPYYMQAYLKYSQNDVTNRYYVLNDSISVGVADLYYLYMLNDTDDTTVLKLTLRKTSNYAYYPNLYVKLQRYFVGEGVYRTVQMGQSDDFGLVTFDIIEQSVDYRLIVLYANGTLIQTSTDLKFSSADEPIELIYLVDDTQAVTGLVEFSTSVEYNASTGRIIINWSDDLGDTYTVEHTVERFTITGIDTVCSGTQTGSSGQVLCRVDGYTGEAFVSLWTDNQNVVGEWVEIPGASKLGDVLDSEDALFWTMLLFVSISGMGAASALATIIVTAVSLVLIYFLGIANWLTVSFIVVACIVGITIALKVKRT